MFFVVLLSLVIGGCVLCVSFCVKIFSFLSSGVNVFYSVLLCSS